MKIKFQGKITVVLWLCILLLHKNK